jgi:flagellar basal body-associated protein FliL
MGAERRDLSADAMQDGADLAADCSLSRNAAVPRAVWKACLWGRLPATTAWGAALAAAALAAAALAAGAVAVSAWQPAPQEVTLELNEAAVFYPLPPFIAELKQGKARVHSLQVTLAIEIPESQQRRLEGQQSAIEDAIKAHMRHFDRRDLEGSAGADRLRNDVLAIVNDAISPAVASRVLYLQFVID